MVEAGTPALNTFSFPLILEHMKYGSKMYREGWEGQSKWITLQEPYPSGLPIINVQDWLPYIVLHTAEGQDITWSATQEDLSANDWRIASVYRIVRD